MINPTRARRMRYRLAAMAGMPEGKLILLNGGSSAGKTSLALAFQDLAAECWMHIGIDLFWFALPPEQLDLARVRPEYYTWDSAVEADGLEWFTVHPGPILDLGHAFPLPRHQGIPGQRNERHRRRRDLDT
ncbi:hypothetical protein TBKG_03601 [Mycobacterium tuberculosis '98-R604 INH-RIF-EM']|nr:hypothetical protein TBKG_03601 [Mycobacterium tuberculosis '98-R604 INH-RIF-EM']